MTPARRALAEELLGKAGCCRCSQEEGDSDCPVHPTCAECGADISGAGIVEAPTLLREALEEIDRTENGFLCPDCGLGVKVDEDACCTTCGIDCFGFEDGKSKQLERYVEDFARVAAKTNALRLALEEACGIAMRLAGLECDSTAEERIAELRKLTEVKP